VRKIDRANKRELGMTALNEIIEAKRKLYSLLLNHPDLTHQEIEIIHTLSLDSDIQEIMKVYLEEGER